ncbi:DNA polymerase subunit gamma-2, mitochondrial [Chelonus insularis]|uniref:DNA polymerase subunit gamma-2, mitochondrial n=1 Tax=Chelonus insularis TaxID=460826 RepID=UPI00158DC9BD|nr:DNA polymerase subunit gamma-2, mitochondrial [Chelonus insularis]
MTVNKILKDLGTTFLNFDKGFSFGPQGKLLRRNLEELWFRYCVIMPPYNVFLSSSETILATLENLSSSGATEQPIGIAVLEENKNTWNTDFIKTCPKINSHRTGKIIVITDASEGKDVYHKKQRERKVWWRKFSREPARFQFTEVKKTSKQKETIEISAEFDFGSIIVETISFQQDAKKLNSQNELENSHIVECIASLDWGCLALLCDAYSSGSSSHQLKLHPKLAPFKIGLYVPTLAENESDSKVSDRARLVLYLNNHLKGKGVETVVTTKLEGMDTFHVPLMVTVDDMSLQNGIVYVWNRLTTLAEQVHITDLAKYVLSRCY